MRLMLYVPAFFGDHMGHTGLDEMLALGITVELEWVTSAGDGSHTDAVASLRHHGGFVTVGEKVNDEGRPVRVYRFFGLEAECA
jgi:hypothetical protein